MPRLQQYVSQEASRGRALSVSRVTPEGVDINGALRGVAQAADTFTQLQEVQRKTAEQLQLDEARMTVANTISEAQVTWAERLQKAQNAAPRDAAGFTDGTLKEFDAWAKERTDANMHPGGRKLLEESLRKMRLGLHAEAFKFETTQRRKALVDDFSQGVDTDVAGVMMDPGRWADSRARRLALVQSLDLTANERAALEEGARTKLAQAAVTGIINQPGGPEAFLAMVGARSAKGRKGQEGSTSPDAAERVASNPILADLPAASLQAGIDRASMILSQQEAEKQAAALRAEAAYQRQLRKAEAEFNVFQALHDKGTALNPAYIEQAIKATAGTPYQEGVRKLAQTAQETGGFARQSLPEQRAMLAAVDAQIAQQGRTPALDKRREMLEKIVKGTESDVKADPFSAGVQRGWLTGVAPVDMTNMDTLVGTVGQRVEQAEVIRQKTGEAHSPFSESEARSIAQRLEALPPDQKADRLSRLRGAMPQHQAIALAKQINDKDKPLSLALADGRPVVSELILRGAQAIKDKGAKEDTAVEIGLRAQIAKEIGDAVPAAARENVIDAARLVYLGKRAQSQGGSEREAVRLVLGGEIVEHNGRKIAVPEGIDIAQRVAAYPKSSIRRQAPDGNVYLPMGGGVVTVPIDEFMTALPGAQLEPTGFGQYMVRIGGSLATNSERKRIELYIR